MTNDKCPRCGAESLGIQLMSNPPKNPYKCGSHFDQYEFQSELCETRQELESFRRELHTVTTEKIECARRSEKAEAELAKRERALEQAWGLAASDWTVEGESIDDLCRALHNAGYPDLAEWLKNRGKS